GLGARDDLALAVVRGGGAAEADGRQVLLVEAHARRVGLADPDLAAAVRAAVGGPVAAVIVVPVLPTDVRHNSKVDRARLGRWAAGILTGGRVSAP
ncbi:hypothetical protein, partial [Clavibacter michiganensis]|uniref:hypothetical protein n=1 Tax=Clavibacter michiganensis TaxID=28447 RepID=UPI0020B15DF4